MERTRRRSDITFIYSILVSIKELEELKQQFSKFANKNNMLSKEDFNKLLISKVGEQGMYFMEDMFKVGTLSFSLLLFSSLSLIGVSSPHFSSCPALFSQVYRYLTSLEMGPLISENFALDCQLLPKDLSMNALFVCSSHSSTISSSLSLPLARSYSTLKFVALLLSDIPINLLTHFSLLSIFLIFLFSFFSLPSLFLLSSFSLPSLFLLNFSPSLLPSFPPLFFPFIVCFSLFDVNDDGFVQPEELHLILGAQYKLLFPDEDLTFVKNFVDFASLTV